MKKLMWIVCLLVVSVTAQAQFEKGKWIVNPSVTGLGLSYSKSEKTQFGLQAQGGAFLVDNVALMLTAGANWFKHAETGGSASHNRRKISTHWVWVEDIISTNAAFISEPD